MGRETVWDGRLAAGERAALRPDGPQGVSRRPDVLVVGGGAIGLTVAVACLRAGLGSVVVLEREPLLAAAASGANAGAIAPDMHLLTDSAEFVAFGRASRQLYREWDAEWGGAIGLRPTRWLNIFPPGVPAEVSRQAPEAAAVPARLSGSASEVAAVPAGLSGPASEVAAVPPRPSRPASGIAGLPVEFRALDAAAVRDLEPDVRLPEGGSATLVDGQLGVNPQRLMAVLAGQAGRYRGRVVVGVEMRGVTIRGDRIVAVHTTVGDWTPGVVVLATGLVPQPWADTVAQRWVKGHMLAVGPGPWRLGSVLAGPLGGGTPLADSSVVCGGTFDDGDLSPEVRPEIADSLAAELAAVLPASAGAPITHRWCCFRPYIEGSQPVIDRLPGVGNGWFAGGHFTTGIMMAAATGTAVAAWLRDGARPELIKTFHL